MAEPDWIDEELDWGPNRMGQGRAFAWSAKEAAQVDPDLFPIVGKRWGVAADGRTFLVESVELTGLLDSLAALPGRADRQRQFRMMADSRRGAPESGGLRSLAFRKTKGADHPFTGVKATDHWSSLPPRRLPDGNSAAYDRLYVAQPVAVNDRPGVVIDWTSISSGSSNFIFHGDETYHVTGDCWFNGLTVVEGGTVVKFQRYTNNFTSLSIQGAFESRSSLYHPAVFTAEDDNTVGETVMAGSPSTNANYGGKVLRFNNFANQPVVEHVRIKHANYGLSFEGSTPGGLVRHAQFVSCRFPIHAPSYLTNLTVRMRNVLIDSVKTGGAVFSAGFAGVAFVGEHLTIHGAPSLMAGGTLTLTNSLVFATGTFPAFVGSGNFTNTSAQGVFSPIGAGQFYLPVGSPHRDAGVSGIHGELARELPFLTTEAPILLTSDITSATTLTARPIRDTGALDRGYHYAPLDYCLSGLSVTNTSLYLTNGVALGIFGTNGFLLRENARLTSEGTALQLNRLVRYTSVQEGGSAWGNTGSTFAMLELRAAGASTPSIDLRFTEATHLAVSTNNYVARRLIGAGYVYAVRPLALSHCQLRGVDLDVVYQWYDTQTVALTNNLFEHCFVGLVQRGGYPTYTLGLNNNLFYGGQLAVQNSDAASSWSVCDNLFLGFVNNPYLPTGASYNGFGAGVVQFGSSNRTNLAADFVKGPLGRYYYPGTGGSTSLVSLVNAGSRPADQAGLYHFATRSDQAAETNSVVDIGFHYPAYGPSVNGLVGHWRFDQTTGTTAFDSSTNALHGTLQYGPQWDREGVAGGCLAFTTTNHAVSIPNAPVLELGTNNQDFSVAFWLNLLQGYNGSWRGLLQKAVSSTNRTPAVFLFHDSNRLHCRVSTVTNWNEGLDSFSSVLTNTWTHVALVKSGSTYRLFLNGVFDSQRVLPTATVSNPGPLMLGDTPYNDGTKCRMDEVRVYSRALSVVEILALMTERPRDTDGEGLADYVEDRNGNGAQDTGETLITDVDTDYDGQSDAEERTEGTNPNNEADRLPTRLAYFKFNSPNLAGEEGQRPIGTNGVTTVPSFDGNGVAFLSPNAVLRYYGIEPSGRVNVNPKFFGTRFLFKPNWTSPVAGGNGPGPTEAYLLTIGDVVGNPGAGYLEMFLYENGNKLYLRSRNGTGQTGDASSGTLTTNPFMANKWSEILLSYNSNVVTAWKDGVKVMSLGHYTNGGFSFPPSSVLANGFTLGNRPNGGGPCQGTLDELEIFNHSLGLFTATATDNTAYAEALYNPTQIRLHWRYRVGYYDGIKVERRNHGLQGPTNGWSTLSNSVASFEYTDSTVAPGQLYDYRLIPTGTNYTGPTPLPGIVAAVEPAPVLERGHALLLVDETLAASLAPELSQFTEDLISDGWQVIRTNAPRHIDGQANWSQNTNNIVGIIKPMIQSVYANPNINLKTVIIFGHVAIPYSGLYPEDAHTGTNDNHYGAWSTDLFYADLDGNWSDTSYYSHFIPPTFPITTNAIGDLKFDDNYVPANATVVRSLEVSIGRIDLQGLPAFAAVDSQHDEAGLLRHYLHKNHAYRMGQLDVRASSIGMAFNEDAEGAVGRSARGQRSISRLCGRVSEADLFAVTNSDRGHLLGYQFGYGSIDAIRNGDPRYHYSATNLAVLSKQPKIAFLLLMGSWFGDWNLGPNNFLRSAIATESYCLGAVWVYNPWHLTRLSLGWPLGDCQLQYPTYIADSELAGAFSDAYVDKTFEIMGDPTLGFPPLAELQGLRGGIKGAMKELSWDAAPLSNSRYFVRRSLSGAEGPYLTLTPAGVNGTLFSDTNSPPGTAWYQVRAGRLISTGSGSMWQLSAASTLEL